MASQEQEDLFELLNPKMGNFRTGETITAGAYANTNSTVPIAIKYTGAQTGCWIKVGASSTLTFNIGASEASATVDTTIGTGSDGVIDTSDAAYDTYGELADYINDLDDYSCILVDAYRSQPSHFSLLAVASSSTTNCKITGGVGFAMNHGLAAGGRMAVGISNRTTEDLTLDADSTNKIWQIINHPVYASNSVNIVIREINDADDTEKIVMQYSGATTAVQASQSFTASGLAAARGNRLVVTLDNSSSAAPTSTSKLTVIAQKVKQS